MGPPLCAAQELLRISPGRRNPADVGCPPLGRRGAAAGAWRGAPPPGRIQGGAAPTCGPRQPARPPVLLLHPSPICLPVVVPGPTVIVPGPTDIIPGPVAARVSPLIPLMPAVLVTSPTICRQPLTLTQVPRVADQHDEGLLCPSNAFAWHGVLDKEPVAVLLEACATCSPGLAV